jgi:hypothetical protein
MGRVLTRSAGERVRESPREIALRSHLPAGATVPIGWVAVGEPIRILPPDKHDEIWGIQKPLNFPLHVYGFDRGEADMLKTTTRLCHELGEHRGDTISC